MSIRDRIKAVREVAEARGDTIPLEGAWRPDSDILDEMVEQSGPFPYRSLTGILAGTEMFDPTEESFELRERSWVEQFETNAEITDELLNTWDHLLVPPSTAAGLFITLGIHPAWGVHVAHDRRDLSESDSAFFPSNVASIANSVVSNATSVLHRVLSEFQENVGVDLDTIREHMDEIREEGMDSVPENNPGLNLFVDLNRESGNWSLSDFIYKDYIGQIGVGTGKVDIDTYLENTPDPESIISR